MDTLNPQSLVLQWHVTERCNWRCKHCYQESYSTPEMNLEELFRVRDEFLKFIDSFENPPRNVQINITGGEPFARRDILEFLGGIAKYNNRWSWGLLSNGSFLDKENVKYLKFLGIGSYQVSIEGMEAANDEIRGKGAFQKTVRALELLKEAGIRTAVSLTLTRKNKNDVFALAKFLAPLGVGRLGARRIVPWGSGAAMKDYMLEPDELNDFYKQVEKTNVWLIDNNHFLRVGGGCESGFYYDQTAKHVYSGEALMTKNFCGVKEGRIIALLPDGTVLPCRRLPIPVGKLFENTFKEIYDSTLLRAIRDYENNPGFSLCKGCANWDMCKGGAPCVNYGFTGKWNAPDVQCNKIFHSLEEAGHFAETI